MIRTTKVAKVPTLPCLFNAISPFEAFSQDEHWHFFEKVDDWRFVPRRQSFIIIPPVFAENLLCWPRGRVRECPKHDWNKFYQGKIDRNQPKRGYCRHNLLVRNHWAAKRSFALSLQSDRCHTLHLVRTFLRSCVVIFTKETFCVTFVQVASAELRPLKNAFPVL